MISYVAEALRHKKNCDENTEKGAVGMAQRHPEGLCSGDNTETES